MSDNKTKVIVTAEDRTKAAFGSINRQMGDLKNNADSLTKAIGGLLSLGLIKRFVSNAVDEFNKAEAGFRGLEAVANRSGIGIGRAMQEAEKLASDGLISLQDSQKALQNLLSRGYDLSQATSTIEALKNSAVSGRQASLTLSQAVVGATEGLKNENSMLVDNAGVTKNVSILWKEYAAQIGKTSAQLTQQEKVQAEVSGIMRETAAFTGAAAEAANTLQGQMAKLSVEQQKASAQMGQALMPAMVELTRGGVFMIQNFLKPAIYFAQNLGISFAAAGDKIGAFWRLLKNRDLAAYSAEVERINTQLRDMRSEAKAALDAGLQFTPNPRAGGTGGGAPNAAAAASTAASKAAAAAAARDRQATAKAERALAAEQSEQAARLEQDDLARQIDANKAAFDAKLIDAADYYAALTELQRQQADSEIAALTAQRSAAASAGGSDADQLKARADIVKIDAEIELIERRTADHAVANAASRIAVADALKLKQADFLDALEQEAFLAGLSNDERETALMLLEAEKLGITDVNRLLELQGKIRAANAAKDAAEETQRQQDDLYASVQQGVQRAFADGLNAVGTDGGFLSALRGLVDTMKSALSNALAGGLTDSFMGMLGGKEGVLGMAGSLGLGGKKDGSTPGSAIYVSDVSAASLAGGEGESGGLFAGLGSMFSSMMGGLKAALTSMVSGLGDLLGGLFGDAGGGQNWLGAIASVFGFAEGGYTGAGGKYQPAGVVHAGEFVFSADSVRRLGLGALNNLHRLAKGGMAPTMPRLSYADGGLVNLPGSAAPSVTSNTKIVNLFDIESALSEYLNTRGGERSILNVIQRNPGAAGAP